MARAGDDDFVAAYTAAWPRLVRLAYALTQDAGRAEDAAAAAMVKAYAAWSRVGAARDRDAYLRRMVVNEVLGVRRRAWWGRERHGEVPDVASPDRADQAVVDRDELWQWLARLGPRQRAVLVLRYYEDLSEEQIAGTLGCSRGTVKSQAADALATLRRHARAAGPLVTEEGGRR